MLTLEQAQAAIVKDTRPTTRIETVPLAAALGRYLAKEVQARVDNPAFDNSAMDGYAVYTPDLAAKDYTLPLEGEAGCGSAPGTLVAGSTMRIFTGAPVPAGTDAVVIQEDVKREGDRVVFPRTVQPGQNIRTQGQDFTTGERLYAPGRRLHAPDLALLSAAGVPEVVVYQRPRALVIATGNELVAPGEALRPGQIYECNRLVTLLQLQALGAEAVDGGTVEDDPDAVRSMLKKAGDFDFVVTSGGVSVGDHDLVKQVFAEIGEIRLWKVKIKPGKPVAFGRVGKHTHFFGLPGNPVSSLVTFKLFVEPALAAWHHSPFRCLKLNATATNDFRRHTGRTEFLRARLHTENGRLFATALKGQGSHMLGTLRETNGLIRMEHDEQGFVAGDTVIVTPLEDFFPTG